MRKVPETIESFEPLAAQLLADRHHGVLLTGVVLMLDVCELHPASIETYRRCGGPGFEGMDHVQLSETESHTTQYAQVPGSRYLARAAFCLRCDRMLRLD